MLKEGDGFVIHRRFHFIGEFRETAGIDAFVLVEMIEAQPLAEEFRSQAAGFGIGQHPFHLTLQLLRIAQLARRGGAAEFFIGDGGPQEITETAGQLPLRERFHSRRVCRLLQPVKECGRDQDPG